MNGKFVISLDFEKYWGMRDIENLVDYQNNIDNVDEVVTKLLDIFDKYDIRATWATVGFLFHNNKKNLVENLPENIKLYKNKNLNPYLYIKNNELDPEFHFATDSIDLISSNGNQEIASHTYSHYYCLEKGQTKIDFEKDMELYSSVYNKYNFKNELSTIVFPRNQINENYIPILTKYGITAYRGNENHFIYNASHESEMNSLIRRGLRLIDRYLNITGHHTYLLDKDIEIYNVKSSRFLSPYSKKLKLLEPFKKRRIKNAMTYAAKNNEIFHLWWHPHNFNNNIPENINFLNDILKHYAYLKKEYNMESNNMKDIVEEII